MINRKSLLGLLGLTLAVSGCSRSNDYTPPADATGEAMFQVACIGCHEAGNDGKHFELSADKAKPSVIAEKITGGSLAMPGFPNVKGDKLTQLSEYAISVSKVQ